MQISPCLQLSIFKMLLSECSACVFSQLLFFKLKLSINHIDENQWISKKSLSTDHHPSQCLAVICVYFGSVDVLPVINPIFFYRCAQFPLLRVWNVTVDQLLVIWMQMSLTWIANIFYKFMHFWHTHKKNTNPKVWTTLHTWRWSSTFCSGICCHWFGVNGVCGTGFGESGGVERGGVRYPYAPYASGRPELS